MQIKKYIPFGAFAGIYGAIGMVTDTTKFLFSYGDSIFISYAFIYSGLIAIGTLTFLWCLSEIIPYAYKKIKSLKIEPDTSIKEALEYIIEESAFGKSLPSNQHGRDDAINALKSCIFNKKIHLFGTNHKNPVPVKISTKEVNKNNLEIMYVKNNTLSYSLIEISYVSIGDTKSVLYKNLLIPLKQLKKEFSNKYDCYR